MPPLLPDVPRTVCRPTRELRVETPVGALSFAALLDTWEVPSIPRAVSLLPSGALIARWTHRSAELELLVGRFKPSVVDTGVPVTDCWGAVWRIDALTPLPSVRLSATLPPPPDGVDGGWDGGQCLSALTFDSPDMRMTLGGSDEEEICLRAESGDDLPRRWAALIDDVYASQPNSGWGVEAKEDRGLEWTLPALEQGEHAVLHVAACWTPLPADEDDATTWYAVGNASPREILNQAG